MSSTIPAASAWKYAGVQRGRGLRHRPAGSGGQAQAQLGGDLLAGQPQHGVVAGEVGGGPAAQVVGARPVHAELVVGEQAVTLRAVAPDGQAAVDAAAAPGRLRAQDLLLDAEPLQRQVGQGGAELVEERDDLGGGAPGVEVGDDRADAGVGVVVHQPVAVHRQVLDQVRDAGQRQRLVGAADPEHQARAQRSGRFDEQDRHAVDLVLDHRAPPIPRRMRRTDANSSLSNQG
ncbi:hypothetical protein ACFQZ4_06835 [Catellatospora coxensis]